MGPKAHNFRPLGMPNTLDRPVDGTNAAHLMRHTAHLLHPSQTVMSYFKEPQRAVAEIQRILDGDHPACALLADLSKAFERVNPHWIMYLLRLRGAPRWVLTYMLALCYFIDGSCTKSKEGCSLAGPSGRVLTWVVDRFLSIFSALRWIRSFTT